MEGNHGALAVAVGGDRTAMARFFLTSGAAAAGAVLLTTLFARGQPGVLLGVQTSALVLVDSIFLSASVSFALWLHRAYTNLQRLGRKTLYTANTAVAFLFIPGANLIVPHTIFRELWLGSDPGVVRSVTRMPHRPINLVSLWWFLFLAYSVTSNAAAVMLARSAGESAFQRTLALASVAGIVVAVAGIDIIRLVDARQSLCRKAGIAAARPVPAIAAVAEPADWRSILLPVVTDLETEMKRTANEPAVPPLISRTDISQHIAKVRGEARAMRSRARAGSLDLVRALRARGAAYLLVVAGTIAALQAYTYAAWVFRLPIPPVLLNWGGLAPPYTTLLALTCIAAGLALGLWVYDSYATLQGPTARNPGRNVLRQLLIKFGDPATLGDLWFATFGEAPALLFKSWSLSWRVFRVATLIVVVTFLARASGPFMLALILLYGALAAAAALAAIVVFRISAALSKVSKESAVEPPSPRGESSPGPAPQ
jgi:hypothetical protein